VPSSHALRPAIPNGSRRLQTAEAATDITYPCKMAHPAFTSERHSAFRRAVLVFFASHGVSSCGKPQLLGAGRPKCERGIQGTRPNISRHLREDQSVTRRRPVATSSQRRRALA
jgi:hypothetical protein